MYWWGASFTRCFGFFHCLVRLRGYGSLFTLKFLASACLGGLQAPSAVNKFYTISGGEALTYYDVMRRFFALVFHFD